MMSASIAWIRIEHGTLIAVLFIANAVKWAVFGRLCDEELLILRQKAGYTLWEFCAGFLVFWSATDIDVGREAVKYAGLFLCVLLVKSFRYLVAHRVDQVREAGYRQRHRRDPLHNPYLRLALGIALVNLVDALLIYKYLYDVIWHRYFHHNVLISLFGYELLTHYPSTLSTSVQLALKIYEASGGREAQSAAWRTKKARILFVAEFLLHLLKFAMSCIFSVLFLYYYTVPFHMVPSYYMNFKTSVDKARLLLEFLKSELLLRRLHTPKTVAHVTCIICYEALDESALDNVRSVQECDHAFHHACLKMWLEYSPTCPTCRRPV